MQSVGKNAIHRTNVKSILTKSPASVASYWASTVAAAFPLLHKGECKYNPSIENVISQSQYNGKDCLDSRTSNQDIRLHRVEQDRDYASPTLAKSWEQNLMMNAKWRVFLECKQIMWLGIFHSSKRARCPGTDFTVATAPWSWCMNTSIKAMPMPGFAPALSWFWSSWSTVSFAPGSNKPIAKITLWLKIE